MTWADGGWVFSMAIGYLLFFVNIAWAISLYRLRRVLQQRHRVLERWTQDLHRISTEHPAAVPWVTDLYRARYRSCIKTRISEGNNG